MNTIRNEQLDDTYSELPTGDFWVFAYGSLIWRPGINYQQKRCAKIHGYKRALCVWSWHHRGTQDKPGLVFGLQQSTSYCQGCVFQINANDRYEALDYLKERELITDIYLPKLVKCSTKEGDVMALAFIVNPQHEQFCTQLDLQHYSDIILSAHGDSGANSEYVLETHRSLLQLGIEDPELTAICEHVTATSKR